MANTDITVVKARPCSPAGYEVNDKTTASLPLLSAVVAGDLLALGSTGWDKTATSATDADGIALRPGYAGEVGFDIGIQGEMDGFSGLTPGAGLYPSLTTAGKIETVGNSGAVKRIKAVRTTRIRFNFI